MLLTWTPLIASTDFDGIKADIMTSSSGMLMLVLIILGVGMLFSVFRGR